MALARCPAHPPDGLTAPVLPKAPVPTEPYTRSVQPEGYPNLALLCGHAGCREPALIWLTENEAIAYHFGDREFGQATDVCGFRVR